MVHRKERFIYSYMSLPYGLRSILHWLTPFGTATWRLHPWLTVVTFAFHICLVLTPIFLLAHIVLWDEAWNLSWRAIAGRTGASACRWSSSAEACSSASGGGSCRRSPT